MFLSRLKILHILYFFYNVENCSVSKEIIIRARSTSANRQMGSYRCTRCSWCRVRKLGMKILVDDKSIRNISVHEFFSLKWLAKLAKLYASSNETNRESNIISNCENTDKSMTTGLQLPMMLRRTPQLLKNSISRIFLDRTWKASQTTCNWIKRTLVKS